MDIAGVLQFVFSVVVGLLILVVLVVVHELGHAIAARRNGVVVEEFGIGFPPKAWSKKLKNGILLSVNWLPLGGFVKLQGENDAAANPGDYGAARLWVKTKILLAGVGINWLVAVVIFTVLAITGLPKILPQQFTVPADTRESRGPVVLQTVASDSSAQAAGLRSNDEIVRFNGHVVPTPSALTDLSKAQAGKPVEIIYKRDGREATAKVALKTTDNGQKPLGVAAVQQTMTYATWSAPIVGLGTAIQFTGETLKGLGEMLANLVRGAAMQLSFNEQTRSEGGQALGTATEAVAGPLAILTVIFPAAQQAGPTALLLITALISLTLAIMNTLPLPALDGGRLFVTALFKLLRKPLTKEREEMIHGTGFMVLLLLLIVVTIADAGKLF